MFTVGSSVPEPFLHPEQLPHPDCVECDENVFHMRGANAMAARKTIAIATMVCQSEVIEMLSNQIAVRIGIKFKALLHGEIVTETILF